MIPAERQELILGWLAQQEVVSIAELTERLSVSHMTVRRDIWPAPFFASRRTWVLS